ncbi:hypothetical protein B0H14DRAFT_3448460 [Mycena olivaceomarginata]|nr:hypothetical protein B0H14DRAFT_3448460 [Mycena olivaceomarginata]
MSIIEIHDSDSEPEGSPAQPETQSNSSLPMVVPKTEETPAVVPRDPAPANAVIACGTETQKIKITREEKNQESWDGSGRHTKGDAKVYGFPSDDGFTPDLKTAILCRRVSLTCNGIDQCEFLDPTC